MERYIELSNTYPHFVYQAFKYQLADQKLEGGFTYIIKDKAGESAFEFFSSFSVAYIGNQQPADTDLDALVFSLGMAEALSYWKLTCAPTITVACGQLDSWQVAWWKHLITDGLSEFFYLNAIQDWTSDQLTITSTGARLPKPTKRAYATDQTIVPIGGGKDSITSLAILDGHVDIVPIVMNPVAASTAMIAYKGYQKHILIRRSLDPQIVELNAQGFLNGHIPFSAVLSLYTMVAARMYGIRDIALSNESSANEPTILGTNINHQYSKSLRYEQDINAYASRYLDADIRYFSLLRPLNEYQITHLFSRSTDEVLKLFRSCNKGSKQGIWCTKCPKCLFTYIMLSAHLPLETMVDIFGSDLLEDADLEGYFLSLTGQRTEKPFECVGTIEEVNAAVQVIKEKRAKLPRLLSLWDDQLATQTGTQLLDSWDEHNLPPEYELLVKQKL